MTEPRECCREAAKEIAANIRQLCMYAKTPEAIQQIIAKHCHADGPSCTVCGKPMALVCPSCGSTPELTPAVSRQRSNPNER
jgi:hypothetical protein